MIEDQLERLISAMGRLTAALEASGAKPTVAPAQSTVAKSATVEPKSAPAVAPSVMDESSAPAVAPTAPTVAAASAPVDPVAPTAPAGTSAAPAAVSPSDTSAVSPNPVPATVTLDFLKARCLECSKLGKMAVLKEFLISKNAKRIQDLAPDEFAVCYQHLLSKGACSKGD